MIIPTSLSKISFHYWILTYSGPSVLESAYIHIVSGKIPDVARVVGSRLADETSSQGYINIPTRSRVEPFLTLQLVSLNFASEGVYGF
jgi:hypothetical protein